MNPRYICEPQRGAKTSTKLFIADSLETISEERPSSSNNATEPDICGGKESKMSYILNLRSAEEMSPAQRNDVHEEIVHGLLSNKRRPSSSEVAGIGDTTMHNSEITNGKW